MKLVRFTTRDTGLDVFIVPAQLVAIEAMDSPNECRIVTTADGVFGVYRVDCQPGVAVALFEGSK